MLAKWWAASYDSGVAAEKLEAFLNDHWVCEGNAIRSPSQMFELIDEQSPQPSRSDESRTS